MNITRAIEILLDYWRQPRKSPSLDQLEAMKLGIEALKLVEHERKKFGTVHIGLLLGETED